MANPPIEVLPTYKWTDEEWVGSSLTVNQAVVRAEFGLETLGIQYSDKKLGNVEKIDANEQHAYVGTAESAGEFKILLSPEQIDTPGDYTTSSVVSCTVLHEVVHCIRMEHFDLDSMMERVVSEGLAYMSEQTHAERNCAGQITGRFRWIDLIRDRRLESDFMEFRDRDFMDDEASAWFHGQWSDGVSAGVLYGAQSVVRQLDRGFDIPDLIRQPAGEILGL